MTDHPEPRGLRTPHANVERRALRSIALFETIKGVTAVAAGAGLLSLLHHDLHHLALALIGHIGLDPEAHYPSLLLHYADVLKDANLRTLLALLVLYVALRFVEAWGLWNERRWGQWLGALSGALYVPLELQHLWHHPTWTNGTVLAINVAVVAFLAWQLWHDRRARAR